MLDYDLMSEIEERVWSSAPRYAVFPYSNPTQSEAHYENYMHYLRNNRVRAEMIAMGYNVLPMIEIMEDRGSVPYVDGHPELYILFFTN